MKKITTLLLFFTYCLSAQAQDYPVGFGIRLTGGISSLHDELIHNQFGLNPSYGCSLFGNFIESNFKFRCEAGFERKGAYDNSTQQYIGLNYWFFSFQPLIRFISRKAYYSAGVYGAFLPNRMVRLNQHKYPYQFNTFDLGIEGMYHYKWFKMSTIPVTLSFGSRYSLVSVYDNNNQGPYVALTNRESSWTRNIVLHFGFELLLN